MDWQLVASYFTVNSTDIVLQCTHVPVWIRFPPFSRETIFKVTRYMFKGTSSMIFIFSPFSIGISQVASLSLVHDKDNSACFIFQVWQ